MTAKTETIVYTCLLLQTYVDIPKRVCRINKASSKLYCTYKSTVVSDKEQSRLPQIECSDVIVYSYLLNDYFSLKF